MNIAKIAFVLISLKVGIYRNVILWLAYLTQKIGKKIDDMAKDLFDYWDSPKLKI